MDPVRGSRRVGVRLCLRQIRDQAFGLMQSAMEKGQGDSSVRGRI